MVSLSPRRGVRRGQHAPRTERARAARSSSSSLCQWEACRAGSGEERCGGCGSPLPHLRDRRAGPMVLCPVWVWGGRKGGSKCPHDAAFGTGWLIDLWSPWA